MNISDLKNKNIVLYGGAYTGRYITVLLEKIGISISEVIDSNPELWGSEFANNMHIKSIIDFFANLSASKKDYIIITAFLDDTLFKQNLKRNGFASFSWKEIIDMFVDENKNETYNIDYNANFKEWFMGLRDELDFWETVYAKPNARKHSLYLKLANTLNFYEKYITREVKENDIIMDIGSGILSRYGSELGLNEKITLIPVDPLASWYNFFNKKYLDINKVSKKEKIAFGIFERLSYIYDLDLADVIIISNALDHCIDPYRSILESLRVLKIGGTLLLKHLRREAINEKEVGLHQWNIDVSKKGEFIIWNRENYINVSNKLEGYIETKISVYEKDERDYTGNFGFLVIEIIKRKEIDDELLETYEKNDISLFVEKLEDIFHEIMRGDYRKQDVWIKAFQLLNEGDV